MKEHLLRALLIATLGWIVVLAAVSQFAPDSPLVASATFDADSQHLDEDPALANAPVHARLDVALLQLDPYGPQTDVLCARSVPLAHDTTRTVNLWFDARPQWIGGGRRLATSMIEKGPAHGGARAIVVRPFPWSFEPFSRWLSMHLRWQGQRDGVHRLQIDSSRSRAHGDSWDRHEDAGLLPSLAMGEGDAHFLWLPKSGTVLALRVCAPNAPVAEITTRAFWHDAAKAAYREPGRVDAPFVPLAAGPSRAVASLLFLDPALAETAANEPADTTALPHAVRELRTAALRAMTGPAGTDDFRDTVMLRERGLAVQRDPAAAAEVLANSDGIEIELREFRDVTVEPEIAGVWNEAVDRAVWGPWVNVWRPLAWLAMLLPIAIVVLMLSVTPRDASKPAPFGRGALLAIALAAMFEHVTHLHHLSRLVSGIVFVFVLVPRARHLTRLDRALAVCLFAGFWSPLAEALGLPAETTPLGQATAAVAQLRWLLVARLVQLDGTWRREGWLLAAVTLTVATLLAWPTFALSLEVLLAALAVFTLIFLAFWLAGRHPRPEPQLATA